MSEVEIQIRKLLSADDETIRNALQHASVPTLMMCMIHLSGDTGLLDGEIRPLGVYINEYQGFMPPDQQQAIRDRAFEVIRDFKARGGQLPPPPDEATIHRMMSFIVGQDVPADYIPMMLEEMELDGRDQRSDAWGTEVDSAARHDMKVLVIGGGMSGVLAAIRLKEAGLNFEVFEKNPSVGGTWYENHYPGARVDVGNHLYSYSFEPAYHWTQYFSQQPELQTYFENCIDKYGVREHFHFNSEVTEARWDERQQQWQVTYRDADGRVQQQNGQVLISAVGQLNRPKWPDIDGRERFQGQSCHSAAWDDNIDCHGKKVVVIGSGASAFQLVPELAKQAASLTVFQRSAPWMFENALYHNAVEDGKKWCLEHLPYYTRWFRFLMFWAACDGAWETVIVDPDWPHQDRSINETNDIVRQMFSDYIKSQIGDDEELLAKVIPDYAPMGKRTLQDNGSWLGALKQPHVELNNRGIDHIDETGVVDSDGTHHAADIIIYATGFHTDKFLWPMDIIGRDNVHLAQQWGDEPSAYLGVTVPNFPNFFVLFGPGTNLAFGGSLIFNGECQVRYTMEGIKLLLQQRAGSLECKQSVHEDYYRRLREQHAQMIWEHPSIKTSYYQNTSGKVTLLWPWKILDMWRWTQAIDADDYLLKTAAADAMD